MATLGALLTSTAVVGLTAAPAAAHTPVVTSLCTYRVTLQSGTLNVRSHHFTSSPVINSLANGSTVLAGQNGTATGSGYTWRQVFQAGPDGWAAGQFLTLVPGTCFLPGPEA